MKKYIITNLTQISFYIGLLLACSAFILPRQYIFLLGVILILLDDNILKNWVDKYAPGIKAKIEEWTQ